jgi:hypothetical protein
LPLISEALASGELGIDKVVELSRLATSDTEAELLAWAERVPSGAIRRRAELEAKAGMEEVRSVEQSRFLRWSYLDEGRRVGVIAELPAADGAVVAQALERVATCLPVLPGEEDPCFVDARLADALVVLCSGGMGSNEGSERTTVVVHVPVHALVGETDDGQGGGCRIGSDGVIHPSTARRLACDARIQVVVEDHHAQAVGMGRSTRDPSPAMSRQLTYRDGGCTFPGCGTRRYARAHHIRWWSAGGRTDLDKPGAGVRVPPQAGTRAGVVAEASIRRGPPLVPPGRQEVPGRTGAACGPCSRVTVASTVAAGGSVE